MTTLQFEPVSGSFIRGEHLFNQKEMLKQAGPSERERTETSTEVGFMAGADLCDGEASSSAWLTRLKVLL